MKESKRPSKLQEAEANVQEAERIIGITAPHLTDRLMEVTGGNSELVKDLMSGIANVAGNAATLAIANRRVDAQINKGWFSIKKEHHPDNLSARQDSLLFGHSGAQPIVEVIEKIGK